MGPGASRATHIPPEGQIAQAYKSASLLHFTHAFEFEIGTHITPRGCAGTTTGSMRGKWIKKQLLFMVQISVEPLFIHDYKDAVQIWVPC